MTAATLALPGPRLVRADLLKLRRRRGLVAVVSLLTIGSVVVTFAVTELLHLASPAKHGPAGGVQNLGHLAFLVAILGSVAAALLGSSAGAGDRDAGVYRDVAVTGRPRLSLYLARIPGGLGLLLPLVAAGYALAAVGSAALAGTEPTASVRLLAVTGLWVLLQATFYFLLALGLSCLVGSRSYTIAIVLAWRLALTPLLASISALGIVRELVPGVALQRLAPASLQGTLAQGPHVGISLGATAAVLVVWTLAALAAGAWRDTTRDA